MRGAKLMDARMAGLSAGCHNKPRNAAECHRTTCLAMSVWKFLVNAWCMLKGLPLYLCDVGLICIVVNIERSG
uniref:SFRICE_040760 n=1 Tax=Spodoptera frugiperda TaxID=7108 RepID=A0A2H1WWS4_SPOFR